MAQAISLHQFFTPLEYEAYLEQILIECGSPKDPIERMLIQQISLAHFRVARLQADAAAAKTAETIKIVNAAAARVLGEMRRCVLSLAVLRGRQSESQSASQRKLFKAAM